MAGTWSECSGLDHCVACPRWFEEWIRSYDDDDDDVSAGLWERARCLSWYHAALPSHFPRYLSILA